MQSNKEDSSFKDISWKSFFLMYGISITILFGGGFLIRFFRDGDFFILEFVAGVIGVILLSVGVFLKNK
ncbi:MULTISPECIES: hypothetical protein [Bacillus]|uniref:Uncharacterized protein n=2 Tax=Bacillus TaxID=1386 RepID=A0A0M4GBG0_9BACI|nr:MULTISPECIES: hypothetical protein [Bacillus]ALC83045.1 hypothetical protein AM592_16785 [Bacillus gobiensis]MBP1082080.1 hypothetical protein [Bacillus capparidis]MED1096705.1 hypothetical protein [Bacillus capparidis]